MTWRRQLSARLQRERAAREATAPTDEASTPYEKLLRAAESGQFETLVRQARPAEPLAMVTPQEREAELRASGRWSTEGQKPKQAPQLAPPPAAEPSPQLTPNEQYIAEHCRWRRSRDYSNHRQPHSCLTDYDPLADEEW